MEPRAGRPESVLSPAKSGSPHLTPDNKRFSGALLHSLSCLTEVLGRTVSVSKTSIASVKLGFQLQCNWILVGGF